MRELLGVAYLFLPLVGGALLNGLCMKHGWLAALALPVDGGLTFQGAPLFGRNKTYRGILGVGVGTCLFFGLQDSVLHRFAVFRQLELRDYSQLNGWLLGLAMGVASMLTELPNSFIKRRLGIGPGERAPGLKLAVFYVIDQIDVVLGAWLVLAWVVPVTPQRVLLSVVIVFFVHQIITVLGYAFGVRSTLT